MTVAIAVGTRPEIVKMASIIRACRDMGVPYSVIHTGQHYSFELDGVFFQDLDLPAPDIRLEIGSGSHAFQIATILSRLEPILAADPPDVLLVEGDTNSVVGVALVARALGIRLGHVEAGLRSYDRSMPEEMNRIIVDHIADICFAPTERAAATLRAEAIEPGRIVLTGNTVVDELMRNRESADARNAPASLGLVPGTYALATVHRAENTDDADRLKAILAALGRVDSELGLEVVAALHPRTVRRLEELALATDRRIRVIPPLGYLDFIGLQSAAAVVLTDSGGVQEEACVLGVPCVTLRDSTERQESVAVGANVLAGADPDRIVALARDMIRRPRTWLSPFGDGQSGPRIVQALANVAASPPDRGTGVGAARRGGVDA